MNRKHLNKLLLLGVFLLTLSVSVSCGTDTNGETANQENSVTSADTQMSADDASQSEETTPPDDNLPPISVNGSSVLRLVIPAEPTAAERAAAEEIAKKILALTGTELSVEKGMSSREDESSDDSWEIHIGKTGYAQAGELLNATGYGSYRISVSDNKAVITAWTDETINSASKAFVSLLEQKNKNGKLVLTEADLQVNIAVDKEISSIPILTDLYPDVIDDSCTTTQAIFEGATSDVYYAYLSKLEAEGYKKYASNERGKFLSAIYTKESEYTCNVLFEGGDKELCVLVDPYDEKTLPPKTSDYKKVCDTKFVQLGVEYAYKSERTPQSGMCYIWRLEDGRFIIMDGGYNSAIHAKNLMDTLKTLAVDPSDITIAAWVITHFHGDHAGTLAEFVKTYLSQVKIESFICNLPSLEQTKMTDVNHDLWNNIRNAVVKSGQTIPTYRAHPGNVYHFANAEIEILFTLEMTVPAVIKNYNNCSMITEVRFGDFNMMMLGDCTPVTNKVLLRNYGKELEAEVMQVAHHGISGGSPDLNKAINPQYIFWPAGETSFLELEQAAKANPTTDHNGHFYMNGTRVLAIYPAKALITVMDVDPSSGFTDGTIYRSIADMQAGVGTSAMAFREQK